MDKTSLRIWGKDFDLPVSYQNYPGEEVTENQVNTVKMLCAVDFEQALDNLKQYVMKHNGQEIKENFISDIFIYVKPKSIVIPRVTDSRIFALMCNYMFDFEHGLAIVFDNESFSSIGPEDIVL